MAQRDPLIEYQREGYDMFAAMLEGIKEETVGHLFNVRVQAAVPPPAPPAESEADAAVAPVEATQPTTAAAPAGPAGPAAERTTRVRARPAPAGGRHAAPEVDPDATGVLPTVLSGGGPRPPAELQYSGPAEDGSTTRSRSRGSATGGAAGGGAAGGGRGGGEPARNRPCPCGSGRKYKHCHGLPTAARP
jgi:preprotein translocase subunit SecA